MRPLGHASRLWYVLLLSAIVLVHPFSLTLCGDLMLNGVPSARRPLQPIASELSRADLTLANLESPLTRAKVPTTRKSAAELKAKSQFILKADPDHAGHLAEVGIDYVSLANNHTMDYGDVGMAECRAHLDSAGIAHSGAGDDAAKAAAVTVLVTPGGSRVGVISALAFVGAGALRKCTPARQSAVGVNVLSFSGTVDAGARAKLRRIVLKAKENCDFLVVALHWGIERKTVPSPYQVSLGRALIDEGADIVWGHHPHVLQGAEIYRDRPILYSTGNIVSALPAETGLFHFEFKERQISRFTFVGCRISGGRVSAVEKKAQRAAWQRFSALCEALVTKYPHKLSRRLL